MPNTLPGSMAEAYPQFQPPTKEKGPRHGPKVKPEPQAPKPFEMSTQIANAIWTDAPLTREQLLGAMDHYAALEALLRVSGPSFSNHRRDAARFHNLALNLLNRMDERSPPPADAPDRRTAPIPA